MPTSSVDLLVLPCAGASATMYLRWRRILPEWIRVVPAELPGRGSRLGESFVENYDQLVGQLCREWESALQGRYAIFGHSMGALLAYGIVRRQHELGHGLPLALFVSGSPSPAHRNPTYFSRRRSDAELVAEMHKHGGTPDEVFANTEMLRLTLDVLNADYRVCESFRHQSCAPLRSPVHVFAGRDDDISPERIEGWCSEAAGKCAIHWFDGGHFFIREHETAIAAVVVRELTSALSAARAVQADA